MVVSLLLFWPILLPAVLASTHVIGSAWCPRPAPVTCRPWTPFCRPARVTGSASTSVCSSFSSSGTAAEGAGPKTIPRTSTSPDLAETRAEPHLRTKLLFARTRRAAGVGLPKHAKRNSFVTRPPRRPSARQLAAHALERFPHGNICNMFPPSPFPHQQQTNPRRFDQRLIITTPVVASPAADAGHWLALQASSRTRASLQSLTHSQPRRRRREVVANSNLNRRRPRVGPSKKLEPHDVNNPPIEFSTWQI